MKKAVLAIALLLSLLLTACGSEASTKASSQPNTASSELSSQSETDSTQPETTTSSSQSSGTITVDSVPAFSSQAYIEVNNNDPYFIDSDLTTKSFESYSDLDSLGRCGVAYANVCKDTMPTEERGSIGQVKPSGWHTVKYDCVDGKYLYNRCHLIGYQLTAENENVKNLITGTRYLNVVGMLKFEDLVADYVKETGNHVLYRVTPIFDGSNLVASGVLMEAESVEDKGNGVNFCVYCYNDQPGITIDYATGSSSLTGGSTSSNSGTTTVTTVPATAPTNTAPTATAPAIKEETTTSSETTGQTYILNKSTKKFHYPSCSSVDKMKESNKKVFTGSRDDVIAMGYVPCKRCNP